MSAEPRLLCVGTYHKTGTSWMQSVFFNIAKALDIPVHRVPVPREWRKLPKEGRRILVNWRSNFAADLLANEEARVFHLIRDPRDVLLSGARYHETTDGRFEKFLYHAREELDGKSYQQYLRDLPTVEEKLAFEMGGKHLETLQKMVEWDYDNPRSIELRYEDLIEDRDCTLFESVLRFFGFNDEETATGLRVFYENSLFGSLGEKIRARDHVASGRPAQWVTKMPRAVAELYMERHGEDLIKLGYESDKSWLDRLAAAPEPARAGI